MIAKDGGSQMPSADHQVVEPTVFEQHRRRMVNLGLGILRSVPDTEDVVQEAWLRWHRSHPSDVTNPEAFLTTVVTRLSLDRLRRVRARREGPLDIPRLTADSRNDPQVSVELAGSVADALLLVLQRLSPLERVAVVLRDVFRVPCAEVARTLGRTEPAVRQLLSRGRRHLSDPAARYATDEVAHARVVRCFRATCNGAAIAPLLEALAPNAAGVVASAQTEGSSDARSPRRR
jgi:RNA polymerase sigma-70 factor, ECF subfamily